MSLQDQIQIFVLIPHSVLMLKKLGKLSSGMQLTGFMTTS